MVEERIGPKETREQRIQREVRGEFYDAEHMFYTLPKWAPSADSIAERERRWFGLQFQIELGRRR